MSEDLTEGLRYWAALGDNRIGPLLNELIDALADSNPHTVRKVSRRLRLLASSLETMAHQMPHERRGCAYCEKGSAL